MRNAMLDALAGSLRSRALLTLAVLAIAHVGHQPALASSRAKQHLAKQSVEKVFWWWDAERPIGKSWLLRSRFGLTAIFDSSELPPGQAVTLWFIIFNRPSKCSTSPCSVPADVFNDEAQADFYFGSGQVISSHGKATFAAHLPVGDTSFSGKAEVGAGPAVPLTNPARAEVVLALHSHGPALTGPDLTHQLTSFLGGCLTFNGTNGFADGPQDIPDAIGECSTFQRSLHTR